ncbi:hypothetical protein MHYP_G00140800 [Metynnis hypsauchen]
MENSFKSVIQKAKVSCRWFWAPLPTSVVELKQQHVKHVKSRPVVTTVTALWLLWLYNRDTAPNSFTVCPLLPGLWCLILRSRQVQLLLRLRQFVLQPFFPPVQKPSPHPVGLPACEEARGKRDQDGNL